MSMWKLYDDLYVGIPSGITIDSCIIGEKWVTVRSNGNIGMARMLEKPACSGECFTGAYLRDTGCHLRWDNLTKAAVGVAALNAYYNTADRVAGLNGLKECAYECAACADKKIAVVGDCPAFAKSGKAAVKFDLPMVPDFDAAPYAALKDFDCVVVSGDALTTRALPKLMDIVGEEGRIIMDGVSVPSSALFFAFDMPVKRLNGYYCRFDNTMENAARLNLDDVEPGVYPFSIVPEPVARIHEQENLKNFKSSPYSASKFNPDRFTNWEGQKYDQATWSPIYKG